MPPGAADSKNAVSGWVLSDFPRDQAGVVTAMIQAGCEDIETVLARGIGPAMNQHNARAKLSLPGRRHDIDPRSAPPSVASPAALHTHEDHDMARLQSLRDKPDTAREYETIYILRPNTPNEGVAEVNTRIKGVIEGMGGKIIKVDNWGKRRLAYEVAKERKGIYLYWLYLAQPGVVEETERNLRMLDDGDPLPDGQGRRGHRRRPRGRPRSTTRSFEKAAQTAADEEDLFLSRGWRRGRRRTTTTSSAATTTSMMPGDGAAASSPASRTEEKE